jgi:pimeloyl-ACP methyl ester carboxylesterase
MPTIDLPQGPLHYRVAGPAVSGKPPVVFLHGILVNGELWTAVADALARAGERSYAPDLPLGAHQVPLHPDADLHPRSVAQLVIDFLQALDLREVILVGNDTGGALCQFLIDLDDDRIGRLVLTNCDAFDQFPPAPFGLLVKAGRRPGRLKFLMTTVRPTWVRHSALGFGPLTAKPLDADLTRRWITPALTDGQIRRDTARFMRAIDPSDLLEVSTRLHRFTKPVLMVWGAADRYFKPAFAHRLADIFPNARIVEVEGGRTFLPLDEPDRVAHEILAAMTGDAERDRAVLQGPPTDSETSPA